MGTLLKFELRQSDIKKINAALAGLEAKSRKKLIARGLRAGAKVLKDGVAMRLPVDTGVARDSLYLKAWSSRRTYKMGIKVLYDTDKIKAHSPISAKYPDGFFYPATIEYGSQALNRVPIAPMRRTEEGDGPATVAAVVGMIEREAAEITKNIMDKV